ncbi:DUF397 domain-containing protein [Streptomyces sp. NPDC046853]|uniref:DUF397 domain-containing protein n=1 Tax=unclassified Streptomyces TaxID=2593676 RepID=UPI0033C77248
MENNTLERDLSTTAWRKSTYSGGEGGNCLEVALAYGQSEIVPVRDSKDPDGPNLVFQATAWSAFVAGLRAGRIIQ